MVGIITNIECGGHNQDMISQKQITKILKRFYCFYNSGLNIRQSIFKLQGKYPNVKKSTLYYWIKKSKKV